MDIQHQVATQREVGCITSSYCRAKYGDTDLVIETLDEFAMYWAGPTANCIADFAFKADAVAAYG